MLDNCAPLRALMLRGTAKASIQTHTLAVIEGYQGGLASLRAENLALLVTTMYPEMQEQLKDIEITFTPGAQDSVSIKVDIDAGA